MTSSRIARLVGYVFMGVVLVASGTYLLVYLYRWEWNRAVLSGLFFVSAEVAIGVSMVLGRLRRLEDRVSGTVPLQADRSASASASASASDDESSKPFAWLDPTGGGMGVFVPVLMGAGAILSVLAFVVEKVAGTVARRDTRPAASHINPVAVVAAFVMAAVLMVAAIDVLADATQNRPDRRRAGTTTVSLDVQVRGPGTTAGEAAEALWVACRSTLPNPLRDVSVGGGATSRAVLTLDGQIGRHAQRRFVGCLEDATLDRVRANVVEVVKAAPGPLGLA